MTQRTCDNHFIHRTVKVGALRPDQVQCPSCGEKILVFADEDHLEVESKHRNTCRVRAACGEERTYG